MIPSPVVHRAAVPLHHRRAVVGELGHDLAEPLRPDSRGDVHRMHNIGEQHRHLLVLGAGICFVDW